MSFTLAHIVREHAAATPDAPALTFEGVTWSFATLDELSSRSANALADAGVRAGDRVALLTKNTPEFYELMFACSKIGAILVGLNWRLAPPEITAIIDDARPTVVIVGPGERHLLEPQAQSSPGLQRVLVLGPDYDAWRATGSPRDPGFVGAPDDVTLLLYTSGTTGQPKGVMLTNHGMSFTPRLGAEVWGMGRGSVNLVAMPMFHIGGIGNGLGTMSWGGHTVLMREVDTAKAIENIARYGVTHTFFVPAVVQQLLLTPGVASANLSSLQLLKYGASPIGETLLRKAIDVLGCQFMQVYGMTEATGTIVVLQPQDHDPGGPRANLLRSCGRALPWVDLRVVDPDTLEDVEVGKVGEIWIRSGMVMKGYWNNPQATRDAIMSGGWLRTGDAAYLDEEGYIYLYDRFKDMIVSGGENVYPAEVENVLSAHPAVLEVAVIGVPHERWGETVKAIVVLQPGQHTDQDALIAFARERLGRFKCPTSVDFADALPRNASGKLLKRELRRLYWEGQDRAIH
jgi:acyl-CoA synthetase (AMP-forming)/AMP-acid ligase II